MNNYLNQVQEQIKNLIQNYQDNPFNYLNEFDLHSELYQLLKPKIPTKKIHIKTELPNDDKIFSLVRAQYYLNTSLIDLAILEESKFLNEITEINGNPLYSEKIDIAIELKYQPFNVEQYGGFRADISKLEAFMQYDGNAIKTGVVMLFSQRSLDITKSYWIDFKQQEISLHGNKVNAIIVDRENTYLKII